MPAPRGTWAAWILSALLGLLLAELLATLYLERLAPEAFFRTYATYAQLLERGTPQFEPHRYLGFAPTPGWERGANRHNRRGYRGAEIALPKPAGAFRIAALGGSTTYGHPVEDWRLAYPQQLERQLRERGHPRVEVVNAGSLGWTSRESLINWTLRVQDLEPDLAVVYHGVNDIRARLVWPPEAYRGNDSACRRALPALAPPLLEQLTLSRIFLVASGRVLPYQALDRLLWPDSPHCHDMPFQRQSRRGSYPSGIFREVPAEAMLAANPPVYFRRNLTNLVATARAGGAEVVLCTFAFSSAFPGEPRVASPVFRAAYAEMNGVLREVAAATGAPLHDLAAELPGDAQRPRAGRAGQGAREVFTDGCHMTAGGARLHAERVAAFLEMAGLLPGPGGAPSPSPASAP